MEKLDSYDYQLEILENDLDEMLLKADKITKNKTNVSKTIKELLRINTKESVILANDIIDILDDIKIIQDKDIDYDMEDPFTTLQNDDEIYD
jgi:uncharacterized protein (UPF0147 family)